MADVHAPNNDAITDQQTNSAPSTVFEPSHEIRLPSSQAPRKAQQTNSAPSTVFEPSHEIRLPSSQAPRKAQQTNSAPSTVFEPSHEIRLPSSQAPRKAQQTNSAPSTVFEPSHEIRLPSSQAPRKAQQTNSAPSTVFEPSHEIRLVVDGPSLQAPRKAPEKKLTEVAMKLAVLEKATNSFGALGFIWATVVLLGGFAIKLDKVDFWFVTTILIIEGARILYRRHELEWQHHSTRSIHAHGSRLRCILYWTAQFVSALAWAATVILSIIRLRNHSFGGVSEGFSDKANRKAALIIFYSLALGEALLFLVEKVYWFIITRCLNIYAVVSRERGLCQDKRDLVIIRRFFYDAFSRCIYGSVFDSEKMDLVSFAEELLGSDSGDEQLVGARILFTFVKSQEFGSDTIRKIGTSNSTMERLVEMLSWKTQAEAELRLYAAQVVSKLAGKKRNVLRVAGIRGSMESITSLLVATNKDLNLLGLSILKNLALNHDNCDNIGNTRGLLPRIIQFTAVDVWLNVPEGHNDNLRVSERSMKLLRMLVSAPGSTGKLLRREIADIVFTVRNMRDILRYGGEQKKLQRIAIEILTRLALNADTRLRIGTTGGVVRELFQLFFVVQQGYENKKQLDVGLAAGEALAILALENEENCRRMLGLQVVHRLTAALHEPMLFVRSGRILTNLCAYGSPDSRMLLRGITRAAPMVLQAIMVMEKQPLEVSVGLALQIFRLMNQEETEEAFQVEGITQTNLASRIIHILGLYHQPSVSEPRMRRYVVELTIWMLQHAGEMVADIVTTFMTGGLQELLQNVAETTSELERFHVFYGSSGLNRNETTIESLVETAMALLRVEMD